MAAPTSIEITSVADFAAQVHAVLAKTRSRHGSADVVNWYRGCGSASSHKLTPSLFRHPKVNSADELLQLERRMLLWFKRRSFVYRSVQPEPEGDNNELEYLFFMQHYAVPTRVLDWTDNPFIGLFFALTSARKNAAGDYDDDAAVWILDPTGWNEHAFLRQNWAKGGVLELGDALMKGYVPRASDDPLDLKAMHEHPAAIYGIANNARMFAQRGVFTVFGRGLMPMEELYDKGGYPSETLVQFIVPKNGIRQLLADLTALGFTDSSAYPDLHGLSMEIRRRFGFSV